MPMHSPTIPARASMLLFAAVVSAVYAAALVVVGRPLHLDARASDVGPNAAYFDLFPPEGRH